MKIEIKERKLTEGKRALYLEYYETGFRKRENLHLYLLPDDAVGAAKHNRLTYNKAMEIRAERILTPPVLEKKNAKRMFYIVLILLALFLISTSSFLFLLSKIFSSSKILGRPKSFSNFNNISSFMNEIDFLTSSLDNALR